MDDPIDSWWEVFTYTLGNGRVCFTRYAVGNWNSVPQLDLCDDCSHWV